MNINLSKLEAAIAYSQRGWLVFPLAPNAKTPLASLVPHGVKDATKDAATIRDWWTRQPDANVGLATGRGDSGPYVVDVDAPHGGHKHDGAASLAAAGITLPDTLTATTPNGGRHYYYGLLTPPPPEKLRNCANVNGLDGVDVRTSGGYIVAPPSTIDGKGYAWTNYEKTRFLADFPPCFFLKPKPQPVATTQNPRPSAPSSADLIDRARRYLATCDAAVSGQGGHNATLHAAHSLVIGYGLDDATALGLLLSDYNPRCLPPWSERELRHKLESARANPQKPVGYLRDETKAAPLPPSPAKVVASLPKDSGRRDDFAARYEARRRLADFRDPVPEEQNPAALLHGGFLRKGGALLFVSVTGAGKSVAATQFAECFAGGRDWLGIVPVRPLSIGVFQAEDDDDEVADFRNNIREGLRYDGWTAEDTAKAEAVPIYYDTTGLSGDDFLDFFAYVQSRARHDLVIMNPLYSFFGGDLAKNADIAPFVKRLDTIIKNPTSGCGLVIVHHTNKVPSRADDRDGWLAGGAAAYGGAGGATFPNWVRSVLMLRPHGKAVGFFDLVAAKRGKRLNWKDANGNPTTTKVVAHSSGFMYWREADDGEADAAESGLALQDENARLHATAACKLNGQPFPNVAALVTAVMSSAHVGRQKAARWVADCRQRGELVTRKGGGLHSLSIGLPEHFPPSKGEADDDATDGELPYWDR